MEKNNLKPNSQQQQTGVEKNKLNWQSWDIDSVLIIFEHIPKNFGDIGNMEFKVKL